MNNLFDKVYCLNLLRCPDRRAHMIREFSKIGITKYTFFEATDKDSPEVKDAFRSGFVNNNYRPFKPLTNSEIGNFISFRRIFKDIIRNNIKFALICEDDLNFMAYAETVLFSVLSPNNMHRYGINLKYPTLIRLGWKKSSDHHYNGNINVIPFTRISNPCFAINLEMAKKLDAKLHSMTTPSDVYIHKIIAPQYKHHTVFPPIAHDLSQSTNAKFRSEILPRKRAIAPYSSPSTPSSSSSGKYVNLSTIHLRRKKLLELGHT